MKRSLNGRITAETKKALYILCRVYLEEDELLELNEYDDYWKYTIAKDQMFSNFMKLKTELLKNMKVRVGKPRIYCRNTVINPYGEKIGIDIVLNLVDENLAYMVNEHLIFMNDGKVTNQKFFDLYCKFHEKVYGEIFELSKKNPVY